MRVPLGVVRLADRRTALPFRSPAAAAAPHHHRLLHPSADPFVPRVAPCKQTYAGPKAHKGSLKSKGGNMYLYKHQTYWLDIIGLHKHTDKCA